MPVAITRPVSPRISECELTHLERVPIDVDLAVAQHAAYTQLLAALGCRLIELPAEADLPDSVFVEDTAVILPELAIIARPGAISRRPETAQVADILGNYRTLAFIESPATLDGGDVLVSGRDVFVGQSTRSNREALVQLRRHLGKLGYRIAAVNLHGCLHLKSAATRVSDGTLLVNADWVDLDAFGGQELIRVDPAEPSAANCLPIADTVVVPASCPKTSARLRERGYGTVATDLSELAKAEGAVTCCSLIIAP
jgi:dimethylargininase